LTGLQGRHQEATNSYNEYRKTDQPFRTSPPHQRALYWHEPRPPSAIVDFSATQPPSLARSDRFYDSQPFWLALYFCFNLGLTLYNKGVLVQFPFPYTLTAIHALCGSFGGYALLCSGAFVPARLNSKETAALVAFSVLYSVNIAVSNVSLEIVTVPGSSNIDCIDNVYSLRLSSFIKLSVQQHRYSP
jgi:hypothetical protein